MLLLFAYDRYSPYRYLLLVFSLDMFLVLWSMLLSFGLIPLGWDEQNEQDREKIFTVIEVKWVKELIRVKKEVEDNDPDWQVTRYKHSDDATGIYMKFTWYS